ncbi:glycosyltransferase [Olleya aquimaris]|uniref:Glycosyltransferase involved in cell wall biosynthesis n=1 Tax=Olleya aquimaris TaxID=639310 RepID=A0A327RN21_9FLAO|nr:glycosyltransferase [Olleya aquimaris]RAJ16933.1 glycosyltransferase involved in cell wall biosynthesis [Olleya aquimaris]
MNKNLLIIGFVWPEPKSSAAGCRMMQLIEVFQAGNYNITFASACAKTDNAFDLSTIGVKTEPIVLNDSSFDTFITKLNPNIVLFDRFMVEEQFGWRVAEHCPDALRLLDTEDLHSLRKGRQQALKDQAFFDKNYLQNDIAKREIASILRCDLTFMISQVEIEILVNQFKVDEHLLYYLPFLLDPISPEAQRNSPKFKDRNHFITIGNFMHEPNFDAVLFLKEQIWPLIKKELPKAEMHIYGSYVSEKAKQLHSDKDSFLIKGFAEDVNQVMKEAKVCLAPLRFGAGLKGKLIDAMINGTPCITTTIGAEGMYGTLKDTNAFIEDDATMFAKQAVELYSNKIYWNGKQKNGFMIINTLYDKAIYTKDVLYKLDLLQAGLQSHRQQHFLGQILMHQTMQSTKYMSKWIEEKNK